MRVRLTWLGTYVQTRHGDHDEVVGRGEIDIVHDQELLIGEARLSADVGLTRRFGASLLVPVRVVDTSIRYLDLAGEEVQLVHPNIHHRNETLAGLADPMLLGAATGALAGWRFTARAGITIPIGRTEEDPFALGAQGLPHEHIQFGTGTVNPVIGIEVAHALGAWRAGVFALSQQTFYANGKGYQAGDRYAAGIAVRRRIGERWGVRGGVDVLAETAERWGGAVPTDDGNRGRFDLVLGAGASWAASRQLGLELALKVPAVTQAVGGQLHMPAIVELGASWSFGAGKAGRAEHGHDHEHEHGHDHE
ncbi:MAG TPA: hypothetical protein VN253_08705, partial [Kofleriaceae bacterium]|nr:hypothetical protein [Kofleriaceae bacterium]